MKKTLGQHIRELRENQDLALRELARKLHVSAAFISDIELGRRNPSDKVLTEIARILRTPLEDLRKYDTRPPVADLRRLATSDPAYGYAFRQVIDKEVSPAELLELAEKKRKREKTK
jgi:transcriptional regulator with XRE-family HTH domain